MENQIFSSAAVFQTFSSVELQSPQSVGVVLASWRCRCDQFDPTEQIMKYALGSSYYYAWIYIRLPKDCQ